MTASVHQLAATIASNDESSWWWYEDESDWSWTSEDWSQHEWSSDGPSWNWAPIAPEASAAVASPPPTASAPASSSATNPVRPVADITTVPPGGSPTAKAMLFSVIDEVSIVASVRIDESLLVDAHENFASPVALTLDVHA